MIASRTPNIHTRLIVRLVAAGLVIAASLGAAVYYHEIERIDERLVDQATAEGNILIQRALPHMPPASDADRAAVEALLKAFVAERRDGRDGFFVFAEVYDAQRHKISEAIEPAKMAIEAAMDKQPHKFPRKGVWYHRMWVGGDLYLQAMVRLSSSTGETIGFLESVYQIAPDALAEIEDSVRTSVVIVVVAVLLSVVVLYPVILTLNRDLIGLSRDLLRANLNTLEALGDAIAKRDSDTNIHNYRVTIYAVRLAEALELDDATIRALVKGAFLHDVGKIAISDAILLKPGKLTDDEFAVMKTHVEHGGDIIARAPWLKDAGAVVRHHHEKVDGGGYPDRLKGDDIPVTARVFAIADVFDALTSRRPYKEPFPLEKTLEILREGRGRHFDAVMLDAFAILAPGLHAAYAGREDKGVEADLKALTERYFGAFVT